MTAVDRSRRRFLRGRAKAPPPAIRPPWARDSSVMAACTACAACVEACPEQIVRIDDDGLPALDFSAGECVFCAACAEACPEPVFDAGIDPFSHVATAGGACLARRGVHCQSCGDACLEQAIAFRPRIGGPPAPAIDSELCTGCGACAAACPANAIAFGETAHA